MSHRCTNYVLFENCVPNPKDKELELLKSSFFQVLDSNTVLPERPQFVQRKVQTGSLLNSSSQLHLVLPATALNGPHTPYNNR